MKGTPEAPACGFSARTVAALQALDVPFAAVDILPDPRIRQELSAISQLADDPAAVRERRAASAAATSSCEMYESGELAGGVAVGSRRVPSVAVATDSTQYLPRALADSAGHPSGQPVRRLAGPARARAGDGRLRRASTSGCAAIPSCPRPPSPRSATSSPSGSRCSRRAGTSSRSTSPAASPAPARPPARRTGCSPSAGSASASR